MMPETEFGKGLIVCLVKFAMHFNNEEARMIHHIHFWHTKLLEDASLLKKYDRSVYNAVDIFKKVYLEVHKDYDKALSHLIELWLFGAADHLQELSVPDKTILFVIKNMSLGKKIEELQERSDTHSVPDRIWTYEDLCKMKWLTLEIAENLDRGLDLQTDKGKYL